MGLGNGQSFVRSQYGMYHVGKFCLFVTTVIGSYYILFFAMLFRRSNGRIIMLATMVVWVMCHSMGRIFGSRSLVRSIASGIPTSLRALEFDMK